MKKKMGMLLLSFVLIFFSVTPVVYADDAQVIVKGDTKYYINSSNEVDRAEIFANGILVKIEEFYPNTLLDDAANHIKYIFNLNSDDSLKDATKLDQTTQRAIRTYQYYPNTYYGDHADKIKYLFNINNGFVTSATKREKGTAKTLRWYQYYPNTIYGDHGDKIKYVFDLDRSGYVTAATKREKGTRKILKWYQYYPNTVYGHHGSQIKYVYDLDRSGYITAATKREKGTKEILAWYQYYPKTVYHNHGKNIKYIFDLNELGYVKSATKREKGTNRILTSYKYLPKTEYKKHGSRISARMLNVPLIGQLPELPTGCEITATTMMLQYLGIDVDKVQLAKEMPKSTTDPKQGFVGDPFTKKGWSIYPFALQELVTKYAGSAKILTGASDAMIENQLSHNKPVVVWVSPMHGFSVHALVLTGYDDDDFYFNDCWTKEKDVRISKKRFNKIWGNQDRRAISY